MTSGGNNFNVPENQLTKFCAVHALFCSKQDFSLIANVNINALNTDT